MKVEYGDFQQESIQSFLDGQGNKVTYPAYVESYGLYSSRAHLYLTPTAMIRNGLLLSSEDDGFAVKDVMLSKGSDSPSPVLVKLVVGVPI